MNKILNLKTVLNKYSQNKYAKNIFSYKKECQLLDQSLLFQEEDDYITRHIGNNQKQTQEILSYLGLKSIDELIEKTIPNHILNDEFTKFEGLSQENCQKHIDDIINKNQEFNCFVGQGYYNTYLPKIIQTELLQNKKWYTSYTPYQSEISQGRLEALFIFQTLISELTRLDYANASLLDEATACNESINMSYKTTFKKDRNMLFIDEGIFVNSLECIKTKLHLGLEDIELKIGKLEEISQQDQNKCFQVIAQSPNKYGQVKDFSEIFSQLGDKVTKVIATDLMASMICKSAGEQGADIVVGSSQRLGVPMWFGGPSAGFISTTKKLHRKLPGRLVGQSKDVLGQKTFRLSLQTREQHIKRDKSTSNICTAQALLANISSMYSVFNGKQGLLSISNRIQLLAHSFIETVNQYNNGDIKVISNIEYTFDTVTLFCQDSKDMFQKLKDNNILVYVHDKNHFSVSFDQSSNYEQVQNLIEILINKKNIKLLQPTQQFKKNLLRSDEFLHQSIFQNKKSETEMMRYLNQLADKDISLAKSMIPLGSCTMKLNSSYTVSHLGHNLFANIHPYMSLLQKGYIELIDNLEDIFKDLLGFARVSFQPNSGAQGEYMGVQCIKEYHAANNNHHRKVILLPVSAHGTNAATAALQNLQIVTLDLDENGQLDMNDFNQKVEQYQDELFGLMITYPSTCGVFEETITHVIDKVHQAGGLIYMDGANMNAMCGYIKPGKLGFDVCHLNLHKTFSIPHGGGGPGVGPIGVNDKLAPYIPKHNWIAESPQLENFQNTNQISNSPYGSASILQISYIYLKMLGFKGVQQSTAQAILNANYLKQRLSEYYTIKFTGQNDMCAHEFIIDFNEFFKYDIKDSDVAKRLMDYGFHAPTVSFPFRNCLMVEPTESEDKQELDRFADSMIEIRKEIQEIIDGKYPNNNNLLKNAPHTQLMLENWTYPYSIQKAVFPLQFIKDQGKYWPPIARNLDAEGDRLFISKLKE